MRVNAVSFRSTVWQLDSSGWSRVVAMMLAINTARWLSRTIPKRIALQQFQSDFHVYGDKWAANYVRHYPNDVT